MRRAVTGIVFGMLGLFTSTAQAQTVGEEFPDFQAKDAVTGEPISLKDLRGQVVIIDFWATWCGPCIGELPNVKKAYEKFAPKGFEIVSISLDREGDRSKFKSFVKKERMTWLHVMDGGGWKAALATKYNIHSIPAMYLVDPSGKVAAAGGELRGDGALEKAIEKVMKETPPKGKSNRMAGRAAKDLEAADKLLEKKEYARALKAYEKIAASDKTGDTGKKAAAKVKEIKADKEITQSIAAAEAKKNAPGLLRMAEQLADAGKQDKAREYYQKVIDRYPQTEYAEQAKVAMEKLSG